MYQALYRKWRPQTFADVIGQQHITDTLRAQLQSGRLSHAYLFTGTRGTGKTTCAKILARAVNCEHPVNGDPCNECAACRGILDGSVLDVTEIDAASNNGVDNIRDLRDETRYTPAQVRKRVFIIDEVHMLSIGAFNALLKTLEEPPEHVLFILATTELHKVPATILSRCQRFDFRRIGAEDISRRLLDVAAGEGIALTEGAARLIARLADGAMRDALSMLDLPKEDAERFADAIREAKAKTFTCRRCQNLTDSEICPICSDKTRNQKVICVVAEPRDVIAFERTKEYKGLYHVLHGTLSPMGHVGPDDIRIRELVKRVAEEETEEVILATNPDTEGEATAMYISRLLQPFGIKITRLAYGIPVGGHLEFVDEVTLTRALEGRKEL